MDNFICSYSWELVESDSDKDKPKKSGNIENPHEAMLTLTNLEEGVYKFKVTVSAGAEGNGGVPERLGVALTNVTVLPGRNRVKEGVPASLRWFLFLNIFSFLYKLRFTHFTRFQYNSIYEIKLALEIYAHKSIAAS